MANLDGNDWNEALPAERISILMQQGNATIEKAKEMSKKAILLMEISTILQEMVYRRESDDDLKKQLAKFRVQLSSEAIYIGFLKNEFEFIEQSVKNALSSMTEVAPMLSDNDSDKRFIEGIKNSFEQYERFVNEMEPKLDVFAKSYKDLKEKIKNLPLN